MDPRTLDNETTEKLGGHGYYARIARQRSIAPTQHHGSFFSLIDDNPPTLAGRPPASQAAEGHDAVHAALDGVVVTTHDGEDDQNVDYEEGRPTNFVRLDHGQGLQTSCFHLRKDSILVSPGDEVRAGQQIA